MDKLKKAKSLIKKYYPEADCGLFDCRNVAGDPMVCLYNEDGLRVDICYYWSYFEVFGLDPEQFEELVKYYNELRRNSTDE